MDVEESFYFKPDAGRVFATPCDETPSPPCDAQPEEIDVAVAVDRIETATTMKVRRISGKWAGLRSFFADRLPAVGPDPRDERFLWVAGQGGTGIKTSYGLARVVGAVATGRPLPGDMESAGLRIADILPDRLLT
jgi:D-arginine dehydrogenase